MNIINENICPNINKCDACDFKNIPYIDTLEIKKEEFIETLKAENIIPENLNKISIVPSSKPLNYRIRCQIHVKNGIPGFYKKGTNDIVEIKFCPLLDERINEKLKTLNFPKNYSSDIEFFIKNEKLTERLIEKKYDNFFIQINEEINQKLKKKVIELLDLKETDNVLELYAGSGNFSFEIAKKANVLGIDINVKQNHKEKRIEFIEDSVLNGLKKLQSLSRLNSFNKLLADPPRKGIGKKELEIVEKLKLEKIIYVSCNTKAFIKNAKQLSKTGYKLKETYLFDMFPFTKHIESISKFEKN